MAKKVKATLRTDHFIEEQINEILYYNPAVKLLDKQGILRDDESASYQWTITVDNESPNEEGIKNTTEELFDITPTSRVEMPILGWHKVYGTEPFPNTSKVLWTSKYGDTLLIQVTDYTIYVILIQSGQY